MIRVARSDEIPAVLELWGSSRTATAVTPDTDDAVERLMEVSPDGLLVAEQDGRIVGALIAAWDGWRGNMYRLAVVESYRRRGVARQLVEAGHERLRAKGARRVSALVGADDEAARALWLAVGYDFDRGTGRFVRNL
jgi:ribosomal protein S18 acetylase RimI-like enzyme